MFGLAFICQLRPCQWRYQQPLDDGVLHYGFIAQEVGQIAPSSEHAFVKQDKDGTYRMQPWELVGPIVAAIQELNEKLAAVGKRIQEIENHQAIAQEQQES